MDTPAPEVCAAQPRRSVLDVLLTAGVGGFILAVLYPVLRYLKPMSAPSPGGPQKLTPEELAKLARERAVITRLGSSRVLVFEDPQQRLRALDARCTHEGCTVQYVPGDSVIWCACHNGRFDLDGRVLAGPPPRPLGAWSCAREPDGSVVVQPARKAGQS